MLLISFLENVFFNWQYYWYSVVPLVMLESIVNYFIINRVNYTEIDWIAYMQEVHGYLQGELDYSKLYGQTGPLVYPAGFVYIYSYLYSITNQGKDIRTAQYIFAVLYLLSFFVVSLIYKNAKFLPPIGLLLLCASKRLHSIYVLRLFNDPFAMFFLYISVLLLQKRWFMSSCLFFSIALSIKMNILLFLPSFGILLLWSVGTIQTFLYVLVMIFIQVAIGYPFLSTFPMSYLGKAFELNRKFLYKWTVNWKFIDEDVFLSKVFSYVLLILFVQMTLLFIHKKWLRNYGGLVGFIREKLIYPFDDGTQHTVSIDSHARSVVGVMFVGQFIGLFITNSIPGITGHCLTCYGRVSIQRTAEEEDGNHYLF